MSLDKLFVASFGLFIIGFIYWFFFGKKSSFAAASTDDKSMVDKSEGKEGLVVVVEGGYQPDVIKLKKGVQTTLIFKRIDPNPCLEEFIIPDLKIKKYLPLNKEVKITIKLDRSGSWNFHCGMNMYHGKLIVD